jgi:hypothetical protein
MHEKIVFIDNHIAYYGSLNTLSHLDTHETMFRFEGEQVVNLLEQFIGILRPVKQAPLHGKTESPKLITREECATKLRGMRFKIGTQRHIPFYAILYNRLYAK